MRKLNWTSELQKELERLQQKYQAGFECIVDWQPTEPFLRPRITRPDGKKLVVHGEWKGQRLIIYEHEKLKKAIHTLHHEFIEYILINDLVDDYVILANSLQNVFRTMAYKKQELRIEQLARLEDQEYEKMKKNDKPKRSP